MTVTDTNARLSTMQSTIADLAKMLSEDGAALTVITIDAERPAVELNVELDDLDCADCVLPPDQLRTTIAAALHRDTGEAVAVLLHDPRESLATAAPVSSDAGGYVVLDPCGIAPDDGAIDAGPDVGPLSGKTVAIRHDVLWPAFDWTVEEWTKLLEGAGAKVLAWKRAQGLKDEALRDADATLEEMLAQSDAAISGLANCGSCTSWSVRDGLIAANRGLPTTVIATAHFEPLAHLLAADGGRAGLRVTVLPYPYSTLDEPTVRAYAKDAFPQLLTQLGATV